jgi:iron complex transport system ATP-binding protein
VTVTTTQVAPYRLAMTRVKRVQNLSRNFRRFTMTGPDVHLLASDGYDQRIKLVLPLQGLGLATLPTGEEWYLRWRELPTELRNPIRTYTIRELRAEQGEIDIDIALHGRTGPASRWALDAWPGHEVAIFAPNAEHPGPFGGRDFLPPAHTDHLLLAGDPTALPAIAAILERLPADSRGVAVVEVEDASDRHALGRAPVGVDVRVVVRQPGEHGSALIPAVIEAAADLIPNQHAEVIEDVDVDADVLWEAPRGADEQPARENANLYAWLAGEAGVIKLLRRHLVGERGMDRSCVAFMGYWRLGKVEDNS